MAEFKTNLPQEGTTNRGESLPEPGSQEPSSGCPSDSGGGTFRSKNLIQRTNNSKPNLTQQVIYKGLFTNRPRSNSYSGIPSEISVTNAQSLETLDKEYDHKNEENDTQNWQEVNSRKRQRSSPNMTTRSQKQTKLSYWLAAPVPTSNMFADLETTEKEPKTTDQVTHQVIKPPPFFIDKVSNIQPLSNMLEDVAHDDYEIKILQGEKVKIQAKSSESYSTIYKELKSRNTEFYTYQPKREKNFRVVLKRMHPSTDTEEIKQALEELHHKPNNIWNVKNSRTKKPLPMFFIDLQPSPNNKDIYSIRSLLNCQIEIEPPRPKRSIPQCSNCQQYGHTQKYCHRQPSCVKCAGPHHTANCPRKERSDKVKCILCEGNHPANYKGCIVYKELQKIRYPRSTSNNRKPKNSENVTKVTQSNVENNSGKSYATSAKNGQNLEITKDNTTEQHMVEILRTFNSSIQALMNQMLTMTQMLAELMSKLSNSHP